MIIIMTFMEPSTKIVKFMGPGSRVQDLSLGKYGHTMYSENVFS